MAGIVAAETDNGTGIAGVGYAGVRVMPVTVLGADGTGQDSDIIEGVVWAADHGADVILMAFSNPGYSASLQAAVDYAWSHGVVIVAATGNDGSSTPTYPAGDEGVVGVSATNASDNLAGFSNSGADTFIGAPGVNIPATQTGGGVTSIDGTSAAAAHVAAAAALLRANDGSLSNGVIVGRLGRTADAAGTTAETGNGRLNLARALSDTSTDGVKPEGAPGGGPLVGPYVAASRTINLATLNGGASVTVGAGATITASVNVTTDNGGGNQNWRSTSWRISTTAPGTVTCFDSPNHDGSGTYSESFSITAPTIAGTYNVYFLAHRDDSCTAAQQSALFTLANAVVVDTAPPTSTITFPVNGAAYNATGWTDSITGTATDGSSSGVASVAVSIKRNSDGRYWNGAAFVVSAEIFNGATGTTSWSYAFPDTNLTDGASYLVRSKATDNATNPEIPGAGVTVTYDTTPPTVTIVSVVPDPTNGGTTVTWHATENGAYSVRIGATTCANGTVAASGTYSTSPANIASAVVAGDLAEGANTIRVCVTDAASNTGSATSSVTKDTAPPTSTITFPVNGAAYNATGWTDSITGTATDGSSSGVASVAVSIKRNSDGRYWNGAAFVVSAEIFNGATGTTSWSYAFPDTNLTDGASYLVRSKATDNATNPEIPGAGMTVTYDTTPPSVVLDLQAASDSGLSTTDNITNKLTLRYDVTFSETVGGVALGDFSTTGTATGCGIGNLLGSGPYTIDLTSCSEGTVTLTFAQGGATDTAGNDGPTSDTGGPEVTTDRTGPSVSLDLQAASDAGFSDSDDITNAATLTYDATFNEAVQPLTVALGDFSTTGSAAGCTVANLLGSGPFTVDVTGCGEGTETLTFAQDGALDIAGNSGPASDTDGSEVTIDRTGPTVSLDLQAGSDFGASDSDNLTNAATLTYDVTFNEAVQSLTVADGDFSTTGSATGCSAGSTSGSSAPPTARRSAAAPRARSRSTFAQDGATDIAGNTGPTLTTDGPTVTIDRTPPSVVLDLQAASDSGLSTTDNITNKLTLRYDVTFSETVGGVALGDFSTTGTATGCGIGNLLGSGPYTIDLTSCSEGTVTLTFAQGGATDTAGNDGPTSDTDGPEVTTDRTGPSVSLDLQAASDAGFSDSDNITNAATLTYDATFNEAVQPLTVALGDFSTTGSAAGCTVANLLGSGPFTVDVTGCGEGTETLTFAQDGALDIAGNSGPASDTDGSEVTIDRTGPTVSLDLQAGSDFGASDSDNLTNAATLTYDVTFNEAVQSLTVADGDFSTTGSATGCSAGSTSGSGAAYSTTLGSCSEGTVTLTFAQDGATDIAGNTGPTLTTDGPTVTIDRTPPSVVLDLQAASDSGLSTTDNITNKLTLRYDVTFSETVGGVALGDFSTTGTATGCGIGNLLGSGPYTIDLTSCSEGTVTLTFAQGGATDTAGNDGPTSDTDGPEVTIDRTGPSVSLDLQAASDAGFSDSDDITNAATLTYDATFNEAVQPLTVALGDFSTTGSAAGCTVANLLGSGPFTVDVTGCGEGTETLTFAQDGALDIAGNSGPASDTDGSEVTIDRTGPTVSLDLQAGSDFGASDSDNLTNAATLTYDVTFNEAVQSLTVADGDFSTTGSATGCSAGSTSGSGAAYSTTLGSCSEGTVTLTFAQDGATDIAGNTGPTLTTDGPTVTIDRTPPSVVLDLQAASDSGLSTTDNITNKLTLRYDVTFSETVGGVALGDFSTTGTATGCGIGNLLGSGPYTIDLTSCSEGTVTLTFAQGGATDTAGNDGPTSDTDGPEVTIDRTGPSVTVTPDRAPDHAGWYNHAVIFDTNGSDGSGSGIDTCSADQTYTSPDGTGLTVGGSCTDIAGNSGSGTSATFKFDDTNPGITWSGGPAPGGSYSFGFVPAAPTCTASDSMSGPFDCVVSGYGTSVGPHTMTATAHDIAGNVEIATRSYTVLAWTLQGFFQPVDMNGVYNTVKNGSTVPLKFRIFAGATELTDVVVVQSIMSVPINCSATAPVDAVEEIVTTGGTVLRWAGDQFIDNWKTPSGSSVVGKCYQVTMTADDGSKLNAFFKLK